MQSTPSLSKTQRQALQKVSQLATDHAQSVLSDFLGRQARLSSEHIDIMRPSDIAMTIQAFNDDATDFACSQGFLSGRLGGEALVVFHDIHANDPAALATALKVKSIAHPDTLLDLANSFVGAYLRGFGREIDLGFSCTRPQVLNGAAVVAELTRRNGPSWQYTLAIEVTVRLDGCDFHCDLLIMISEVALSTLFKKLDYLID